MTLCLCFWTFNFWGLFFVCFHFTHYLSLPVFHYVVLFFMSYCVTLYYGGLSSYIQMDCFVLKLCLCILHLKSSFLTITLHIMTEGDYKKKSPKYNIIYTLQYRIAHGKTGRPGNCGSGGRAGHLLVASFVVQSLAASVCMPNVLWQDYA